MPVRRAFALAALLAELMAAASPDMASATKLFITNHINSNQIAGLTPWQGKVAAATFGGIVFADPVTGTPTKRISAPGGLPSNHVLCVAESPSGSLWAGTADRGVARLKPDGTYRRTLTSFDGLPSDRAQVIYVHGDTIWVGTGGGVALFTENPASGQFTLRRSDSKASTGGALVGDDVRAFQLVGDTLWCGTSAGLSVFAGGMWINRSATLAVSVQSLELHADTLWAATAAGPRRYANGVFTTVAAGHGGESLALHSSGGVLYSGTPFLGVYQYAPGSGWIAVSSVGLPDTHVNALETAPDGRLWAGTDAGLARRVQNPGWEAFPTDGPAANGTQRAVADARGVWFVTGNFTPPTGGLGAVLHFDGQSWTSLTSASTGGSLQPASSFAVLSDRSGKLWFGHCCSASDPRPRTERWDPASGVWDTLGVTNLFALSQAPNDLVYGGSVEHGSGVYVFDGTTAALLDSLTPTNTQVGTLPGLASNNLRGISFDTTGRGWFALAANGLDIWNGNGTLTDHDDDVWLHFPGTGFPSSQTTAVVTTGPTSGWVGTVSGLVRIRNDFVDPAVTAATNAKLPSLQVKDLALDSDGNLWVATAVGIARVEAGSGVVESFSTLDGLVADDARCLAWDAKRGVLWVGTADGMSEIIPSGAKSGFNDQSYLYPSPLDASATALRLGGITDEVTGEVRDLTGSVIRRFRCDPAQNEVWNLRLADGTPASPGVYIVVLRAGDRSRILRTAVVR
jgi:ligand-binding sensor domain-containing protein